MWLVCGAVTGANRFCVGKLKRKRQMGTPRRRWQDITKIDLQAVG